MLLQPKRMAAEAVPVAATLLFWNLLARFAQIQEVGGPVRTAGTVMALLYVLVRGISLSDLASPPRTDDVEAILYENARLAVPAGAWFLGAMAVAAIRTSVYEFTALFAVVEGALGGAGLGVVGLYAVAVGYRTFDGGSGTGDGPAPGGGSVEGTTATDDAGETEGTAADD